MQLPSWETLVAGVRSWSRGDERAVHKPLLGLMMLARAQQGGSNVFRFEEVDEPLQVNHYGDEVLKVYGV